LLPFSTAQLVTTFLDPRTKHILSSEETTNVILFVKRELEAFQSNPQTSLQVPMQQHSQKIQSFLEDFLQNISNPHNNSTNEGTLKSFEKFLTQTRTDLFL
jgi:hypothetical protein